MNKHAVAAVIRDGLGAQTYGAKAALARACGVTPQTVGRWTHPELPSMPDDVHWPQIELQLRLPKGTIAGAAAVRPSRLTLDQLTDRLAELEARIAELER